MMDRKQSQPGAPSSPLLVSAAESQAERERILASLQKDLNGLSQLQQFQTTLLGEIQRQIATILKSLPS